MTSVLLSVFGLLIKILSSTEGVADENWYFDVQRGSENEPKCSIRKEWTHFIEPYAMSCYQCNNAHSTVVYYNGEPVGAATALNCDTLRRSTVSLLPPRTITPQSKDITEEVTDGSPKIEPPVHQRKASEYIHRVQYNRRNPAKCVGIEYHWDADAQRFLAEERRCIKGGHYKRGIFKGFFNGWKIKRPPADRGVVKRFLGSDSDLVSECGKLRVMQYKDGKFWLKCYECEEEYTAVLYRETSIMAAAIVGTCQTPALETSVTIVPQEAKQFRVQYLTTSDECVMKGYSEDHDVFREASSAECQVQRKPLSFWMFGIRRVYKRINGWKVTDEPEPEDEEEGWHFDAFPGMENQPKCHIRRQFTNAIEPYSLTCYQCVSGHGTVLYYNGEAIGATTTKDCDSPGMPYSVTLLPPGQEGGESNVKTGPSDHRMASEVVHSAQYKVGESAKCVRLVYQWDPEGRKFSCNELSCVTALRERKRKPKEGFINGWKLKKRSPKKGVVRTILDVQPEMENECLKMQSMQLKNEELWIRCYDCKEELKAILYYEGKMFAAATVGTCRSTSLGAAITVTLQEPSQVVVQYLTYLDQCIVKRYSRADGVYTESSSYECSSPTVIKHHIWERKSGWQNGWRTQIEPITLTD